MTDKTRYLRAVRAIMDLNLGELGALKELIDVYLMEAGIVGVVGDEE